MGRLAVAIAVMSALAGCRQLLGLDSPSLGGAGGDGGLGHPPAAVAASASC